MADSAAPPATTATETNVLDPKDAPGTNSRTPIPPPRTGTKAARGSEEGKSNEDEDNASNVVSIGAAVRVKFPMAEARRRKLVCHVLRGNLMQPAATGDEPADGGEGGLLCVGTMDGKELTNISREWVTPLASFEGPPPQVQQPGPSGRWLRQDAGWELGRRLGGLGGFNGLRYNAIAVRQSLGAAAIAGGASSAHAEGAWFFAAHELRRRGVILYKMADVHAAAEHFVAAMAVIRSASPPSLGREAAPVGSVVLAFDKDYVAGSVSVRRPCCVAGTVTTVDDPDEADLLRAEQDGTRPPPATVDVDVEEAVLNQFVRVKSWVQAHEMGPLARPKDSERVGVSLDRVVQVPLAPASALTPDPTGPLCAALVSPTSPVPWLRSRLDAAGKHKQSTPAMGGAGRGGAEPEEEEEESTSTTPPDSPEGKRLRRLLSADLIRAVSLNLAWCELKRRVFAKSLRTESKIPSDGGRSLMRAIAMCDVALAAGSILKADNGAVQEAAAGPTPHAAAVMVLGANAPVLAHAGKAYLLRAKLRCVWGHVKEAVNDSKRARSLLPAASVAQVSRVEQDIERRAREKKEENRRMARRMVAHVDREMMKMGKQD